MSNEQIKGHGFGADSWPDSLFRGVDANGNNLWQFDKSGNLTITGVLTYGSVANANGAVSFSSTVATGPLTVTGAATISTTLGVTGASTLAALSATTGTFSSTLGVTGATTMAALSATTGTFSSTLGVTGTATMAAINASGTVAAAGAATVGTTLGVTGAATFSSTVATGALTVTGAATVSTTLGVTGASTLTGAVSCGSTLGITGTTTAAAINASGNFNIASGKFAVASATGNVTGPSANWTIDTGDAHTLSIGGTNATTINLGQSGQLVECLGNLDTDGTFGCDGAATFDSTVATGALTVTGAALVSTTLGVTGNTTLGGHLFETEIDAALTAKTGGAQDVAATSAKQIAVVTTVTSGNDSFTLPAATGSGRTILVSNQAAANSMQLFGIGTDTVNAATNTVGVAVTTKKSAFCVDYASGKWLAQIG